MRILVTGGAGFMGSNMIQYLLNKYPESRITNVDKLTYAGNLDNLKDVVGDRRYVFKKADICDEPTMDRIFHESHPDAVLNYAAETHVDRSIHDPKSFMMTDVIGTFTLLELAKKHGIKRYIQISTDEVYGPIEDGSCDELSCFRPSSPYSASKAGADHLVQAYWTTYRLPAIVTHSCNNYGPRQYPEKLIPLFVTNLMQKRRVPIYGDGKQVREWIHVNDHCSAIDEIVNRGVPGESYNIGTGERRENIEVAYVILDALGQSHNAIEFVQDRPGHDIRYALNSTKLKTQLGWEPRITFEKGITETIQWYQENNWWWEKLKSGEYLDYYRQQYGSSTIQPSSESQ